MKALWIEGPGNVCYGDLPEPALQPGWVRLKILAASVCGSDLNVYKFGRSYQVERRVSGHEFVGIIEEVADESSPLEDRPACHRISPDILPRMR